MAGPFVLRPFRHVRRGPFRPIPQSQANTSVPALRSSEQDVEVIHSGSANFVRLSEQDVEVIHSGDNNKVRLSAQYVEIIHAYQEGRSWGYIIG